MDEIIDINNEAEDVTPVSSNSCSCGSVAVYKFGHDRAVI